MTTFQTLEQLLGDTQSVNLGVLRTPVGLTVVLQGQFGTRKIESSGAQLDEELGAALRGIVTETRSATLLEQIRTAPLPAAKSAGPKPATVPPAATGAATLLNLENQEPDAEDSDDDLI